ncbi:hypothetical protein B0J14DRAFT_693813 [Halenospora varia]|nr:hypothetical protein B0J14DRAFT_693813 [Halenospora varia]
MWRYEQRAPRRGRGNENPQAQPSTQRTQRTPSSPSQTMIKHQIRVPDDTEIYPIGILVELEDRKSVSPELLHLWDGRSRELKLCRTRLLAKYFVGIATGEMLQRSFDHSLPIQQSYYIRQLLAYKTQDSTLKHHEKYLELHVGFTREDQKKPVYASIRPGNGTEVSYYMFKGEKEISNHEFKTITFAIGFANIDFIEDFPATDPTMTKEYIVKVLTSKAAASKIPAENAQPASTSAQNNNLFSSNPAHTSEAITKRRSEDVEDGPVQEPAAKKSRKKRRKTDRTVFGNVPAGSKSSVGDARVGGDESVKKLAILDKELDMKKRIAYLNLQLTKKDEELRNFALRYAELEKVLTDKNIELENERLRGAGDVNN